MDYPKVPQEINNIVGDNVKLLAQLFPSAVKDGQVDLEALKEELGQFEEVDKEKYELTWAGKQDAKKKAQEDVYNRTLNYIESDSKNPETTENLYIEGDNLEVLKLLRQNYYGAIKMIYIDPPYNTGNDFVYNDNFAMNSKESDIAEGTRDDEGNPLQRNQQSSNRYHANWLSMMYPRLKVAKDLLMDDGLIFISIDDYEQENLKKICDEVFGESNFVNKVTWVRTRSGKTVTRQLLVNSEYLYIYAKSQDYDWNQVFQPLAEATVKMYNRDDNDGRGKYRLYPMQKTSSPGPETTYDYIDNNGKVWKCPPKGWRMNKHKVKALENDGRLCLEGSVISEKAYWSERKSEGRIADTLWSDMPENSVASQEVSSLFEGIPLFSNPKPVDYLRRMIKITDSDMKDSVILDFFSGSATTAHAVIQLNAEDGGKRKYIMVQLPEVCGEGTEAEKSGFKTICEIGKERIRRAGEKIITEKRKDIEHLDIGFKVFRTADTNIKWNLYDALGQLDTSAMTHTPDLADFTMGFKDIDVVYEVMLRQKDVPLSSTLETLTDIGNRTYLYGSAYLVCLETDITEELIDKLAALDPLPIKFVFRDSAFKDDINLKDETFRRLKNLIERNAGLEKKSYTVEFI